MTVIGNVAEPAATSIIPNLIDYERISSEFSWKASERELEGLRRNGGLNIAHEAI